MHSSNGKANAAPAPRRNVRRDTPDRPMEKTGFTFYAPWKGFRANAFQTSITLPENRVYLRAGARATILPSDSRLATTFLPRHFICFSLFSRANQVQQLWLSLFRAREHARGDPSMRALFVGLVVGLSALTAVPPAMASFNKRTFPVRQVRKGRMGAQRGQRARMHRHRRRHHARRPHHGRMMRLHRRSARHLRR